MFVVWLGLAQAQWMVFGSADTFEYRPKRREIIHPFVLCMVRRREERKDLSFEFRLRSGSEKDGWMSCFL